MTSTQCILKELMEKGVVSSWALVHLGGIRFGARLYELSQAGIKHGWYFKMKNDKKTRTAMYFLTVPNSAIDFENCRLKDGA